MLHSLLKDCYKQKKKVSELDFSDKFDVPDDSEIRLKEQDDAEKLLLGFADYIEDNFDKIFTTKSFVNEELILVLLLAKAPILSNPVLFRLHK